MKQPMPLRRKSSRISTLIHTYALWTSLLAAPALAQSGTGAPGAVSPMLEPAAASASVSNFTYATPIDGAIHLTVGHTTFLTAKSRLSKVYVTDPTVLYAYTANPNEVLITAKHSGLGSVIVWDEAGQMKSFLFSSDLDISPLKQSLDQAIPRSEIKVRGEGERIYLNGKVSSLAAADLATKMAGLYSKEISNSIVVNSAALQQVRLKVRIVEVDRSKLDQFAFNFLSGGGNTLAQTTTAQFPSTLSVNQTGAGNSGTSSGIASTVGSKTLTVSNALNFLLYNSNLNVGATIQDLESRQVLQILAEPTITAVSGQKASFLAGGEFPFPVVQGTTGGLTSITIQFRPYGVRLEFLPVVNPDGTIQLTVMPEVSALDYTNAVNISGYTIPALSTRRAETEVVLKNDQSFAISGLLDKRTTDSLSNTPGIQKIPVLGKLFRSKSINHSTSELIVIVTPDIVDPISEVADTKNVPAEPKPVIPFLDPKSFDEQLPKVKSN